MTGSTELAGARVHLRPAASGDRDALVAIRATPQVRRWWRGDDLLSEFADDLADPDVHRFTIVLEGRVVGLVQFAEEDDPDYRHATVDIYVDPAVQRRGIATDAIRTLVGHLVGARGHHRITIDPAADNVAAIECYRKAGFREVGVMRAYERRVDGSWGDGLLMELVV